MWWNFHDSCLTFEMSSFNLAAAVLTYERKSSGVWRNLPTVMSCDLLCMHVNYTLSCKWHWERNYLVAYNSGNLRLSITCKSALQNTSCKEDPDTVVEILLIVWQPSISVVRPSSAPTDLRYALKGNPGVCMSTAAWRTHTYTLWLELYRKVLCIKVYSTEDYTCHLAAQIWKFCINNDIASVT